MSSNNITTSSSGSPARRGAVPKSISRTAAASSFPQAKKTTALIKEFVRPALTPVTEATLGSMCNDSSNESSRTAAAPLLSQAKRKGKALEMPIRPAQKRSLDLENTSGGYSNSPLPKDKKRKIGENAGTAATPSSFQANKSTGPMDKFVSPTLKPALGSMCAYSLSGSSRTATASLLAQAKGKARELPVRFAQKRSLELENNCDGYLNNPLPYGKKRKIGENLGTAASFSSTQAKKSTEPTDESVCLALNPALDSISGDSLGESSRTASELDNPHGDYSSRLPPIDEQGVTDLEAVDTTDAMPSSDDSSDSEAERAEMAEMAFDIKAGQVLGLFAPDNVLMKFDVSAPSSRPIPIKPPRKFPGKINK